MSKDVPYIKNLKIESSIKNVEDSISDTLSSCSEFSEVVNVDDVIISNLETRIAALMTKNGIPQPEKEEKTSHVKCETSEKVQKTDILQIDCDLVVSCVAGGLAVLVDFLVVRIPKTTNIVRCGKVINQQGSPMTEALRKIGFTSDGKTAGWVKTLESFFGVNYDTSIIAGEKGFTPRSHRLYSLAHDPSPSGLLWALKDAITGTTSYISQDGILKSIPTKHVSVWRIFATPVIWMGHILSDIFTKAGVPIPGSCLLRTLQFGSFGEKGRTIGQVVEYMYLEGYDLRHLATMATEKAVLEFIIRVYHYLTKPTIEQFARPQALIHIDLEKQNRRLQSMCLQAYVVASCGNVAKLAIYQWNPTALNLSVWVAFFRTAVTEYNRRHGSMQDVLDTIEQRQIINDQFDAIEAKLNMI